MDYMAMVNGAVNWWDNPNNIPVEKLKDDTP
jgi:hypothetical protein